MITECEKLLGGALGGLTVERILEDRLREVNARYRGSAEMTLSQVNLNSNASRRLPLQG